MTTPRGKRLGHAWLYLVAVLILHIFDEAICDFLGFYEETAAAIGHRLLGLPLPVFTFSSWVLLLATVVIFLLLLAPFAYRELEPIRLYAKIFAVLMFLNGLAHLFGSVICNRLIPGFYSSPLLLFFGWLLFRRAVSRTS